jgi:THO complex subunit 2
MDQLLTRYHVNSDLAFFLARPMFNHQISLKCEEMREKDPKGWKIDKERNYEGYVQAVTEVMRPVIDAIKPLHPNKVWDDISPQFLTTFWSLTMYDLFVPENVYEKEIAKLKSAPAKIDENKDLNASRKKKEKERIHNLMEKLIEERKRQHDHVDRVMARLKAEKDTWFLSRSAKLAKNETITTFLQLFLFPRCIFTAIDAIYCAKFVQVIHLLKTPNFSTLICFDRIFCDITYTVTSCTENEAQRYGRFLAAMLGIVMGWHKSKEIFEKECVGYPGFVTKFRVTTADAQGDKDSKDHVDFENYRHVVHKWHFKIAKALVVCLESKDYVQIRNALIILTKILPHFPVIVKLNGVIEKRIEKVCEEEK